MAVPPRPAIKVPFRAVFAESLKVENELNVLLAAAIDRLPPEIQKDFTDALPPR